MTTGERIKAARKAAGLTQKALGEKCQMPDSQIRQYELGMVSPKIEQLRRIAAALGVGLDAFLELDLGGVDELTRPTQDMVNNLLDDANDLARSAMETRNQLLKDVPRTREEAEKYKEILLLEQFYQLNPEGQTAAVEAVENLTFNPKYKKK